MIAVSMVTAAMYLPCSPVWHLTFRVAPGQQRWDNSWYSPKHNPSCLACCSDHYRLL